ncbi:hypothetical protein RRG08_035128 [Elysia crispata]|uniref:Uncharacterized protein n=1 Tax=Elysia crispata TaxID=231223 RepID=A0AAE1E1I3_9GAST|nr:hypothetical protein RRG08_035128 [Elysia crispata]
MIGLISIPGWKTDRYTSPVQLSMLYPRSLLPCHSTESLASHTDSATGEWAGPSLIQPAIRCHREHNLSHRVIILRSPLPSGLTPACSLTRPPSRAVWLLSPTLFLCFAWLSPPLPIPHQLSIFGSEGVRLEWAWPSIQRLAPRRG